MTSFIDLGLAEPLLKALDGEGYTTPTPIQAKAIPVVLAARDLVGIAQTGTGKTAAFALPILHRLAADRRPALRRGCRVLVLSPTRELAAQIADSFRTYGRHMGLSIAVVFGGVGHRPQIQALSRGVDILVATPGRLLDHMGERDADISGTEILVLDEADQMLDLGFIKPIRRIVSALSTRRQTLLFSATMPEEIASLARDLLRDPERVAVTPVAKTADRVAQRVIHVETKKKRALLTEILAGPATGRTLVFTRTKRGADRVARHLETAGVAVAAIHGNKSQSQRERALDAFKASEIRVLVATDIAARGIDIDSISLVVNYELPEVPEVYVHRIGRTARAGAEGQAITLCDAEEVDLLRRIERLTRQSIPAESRLADAGLVADATPAERGRRERARSGDRRGERRGESRRHEHRGDSRRGEHRFGDDQRGGDHGSEHRHTEHRRGEDRHSAQHPADAGEMRRGPVRREDDRAGGDRRRDDRAGRAPPRGRDARSGRRDERQARPAASNGSGNGHGHGNGGREERSRDHRGRDERGGGERPRRERPDGPRRDDGRREAGNRRWDGAGRESGRESGRDGGRDAPASNGAHVPAFLRRDSGIDRRTRRPAGNRA